MHKSRIINTQLWPDDYVLGLEPLEKLFFVYLLTNQATEICGIYKLSIKVMVFETGLEKEKIEEIFKKFEKDKKAFYFDGWVALMNFYKHQAANPSIAIGIEKTLSDIPQQVIDRLGTGWVQAVTAWHKTCPKERKGIERNLNERKLKEEKGKGAGETPAAPRREGGSTRQRAKSSSSDISGDPKSAAPGSARKGKPYFWNQEMRKAQGRWWVMPKEGGAWKEFTGKESEIVWR